MNLPDSTVILPGHGAGSSCGKNIGTGNSCTLFNQKLKNWGLVETDKEKFVEIASNISQAPINFFKNAWKNKVGFENYTEHFKKSYVELSYS